MEIVQTEIVDDEVTHWVSNDLGYHAYTRGGLALSIIRSASVQTPIAHPERYPTWLWLETVQGFYLARQMVVDSIPQTWHLVRRLTPAEPHAFFSAFRDAAADFVSTLACEEDPSSPALGQLDAASASVEGNASER